MKQVPVGLTLFLSGFAICLCCDFSILNKNVEWCDIRYEQQLELYKQHHNGSEQDFICCAAQRRIECLKNSNPNASCTTPVEELILARKDVNHTICRDSKPNQCVTPWCDKRKFNEMEKLCQREYDTEIIHIIEDPTIMNKSAIMCCALARKGDCLLDAVSTSKCFSQEILLEQTDDINKEYGTCYSLNYYQCSGSQLLTVSFVLLAFLTMTNLL